MRRSTEIRCSAMFTESGRKSMKMRRFERPGVVRRSYSGELGNRRSIRLSYGDARADAGTVLAGRGAHSKRLGRRRARARLFEDRVGQRGREGEAAQPQAADPEHLERRERLARE